MIILITMITEKTKNQNDNSNDSQAENRRVHPDLSTRVTESMLEMTGVTNINNIMSLLSALLWYNINKQQVKACGKDNYVTQLSTVL